MCLLEMVGGGGDDGDGSGRVLGRVENSFRNVFIADSEERKQTS